MDSRYAQVQGLTGEKQSQPRTQFSKCFWQADGKMLCQTETQQIEPVKQFDTFSQPNSDYQPTRYLGLFK